MQVLKIMGVATASLAALVLAAVIGLLGWVWFLGADGMTRAERTGWLDPAPSPASPTPFEKMVLITHGWRDGTTHQARPRHQPICGNGIIPIHLGTMIWQDLAARERGLRAELGRASVTCHLSIKYSDVQLTRLWLRRARFGTDLIGAEAASYYWFGKPTADLDELESARLAALSYSPSIARGEPEKWSARAEQIARDYSSTGSGSHP